MHTIVYGTKCGATLALIPGAVLALTLYVLSFGFGENPLIAGPLMFGLVTGAIVVIGAGLGAAVGGVVEVFRLHHRKSHGAV